MKLFKKVYWKFYVPIFVIILLVIGFFVDSLIRWSTFGESLFTTCRVVPYGMYQCGDSIINLKVLIVVIISLLLSYKIHNILKSKLKNSGVG